MRKIIISGVIIGLISVVASSALAQNYRRPADYAVPAAPSGQYAQSSRPGAPAALGTIGVNSAYNGTEAPAYGYSYILNLPSDGSWRWIDERCYQSAQGNMCVEGHWVRHRPNACEEVSAHQIRRGNYIRLVPEGPVASCRR